MQSKLRRLLINSLALLLVLVFNSLATTLPLGGRTTAEISDRFPVLFTPAGYVFSIWGVIYLGLLGFVIFQAWPGRQDNPSAQAVGWWFVLSCLANTAWILAWQFGHVNLSLAIMLALLAILIVTYRRLSAVKPADTATRWLVHVPFSVYLGWISVATIANTSVVLFNLGWNGGGLGPVFWTMVMIAAAAALAVMAALREGDAAYAAVIIWAVIGIAVRQAGNTAIVAACVAAIAAALAGLIGAAARGRGRDAWRAAR